MMACEGTQAVLATLLQSVRRKIANDMLTFIDLSKSILPGGQRGVKKVILREAHQIRMFPFVQSTSRKKQERR